MFNSPYLDAFGSAFSLIVVSEIGDKTFFIASLLAMQNSTRLGEVFLGATVALMVMTILSTFIGMIVFQILSPQIATLLSSIGLIYFSISLALTLYRNEPEEESELEEVEKELQAIDLESQRIVQNNQNVNSANNSSQPDDGQNENQNENQNANRNENSHLQRTTAVSKNSKKKSQNVPKIETKPVLEWSLAVNDFDAFKTQFIIYLSRTFTLMSPLFIQCCILTFIAEWGDRSQVATILLATSKSPVLVTFGCIFGHMLCTSIAIFFGKILSSQLNDRHLQFVAMILFMVFGVIGLWSVVTGTVEERRLF
jgi:putative Ca2+/H+ antiporter (TMEM165/GDT1 family)